MKKLNLISAIIITVIASFVLPVFLSSCCIPFSLIEKTETVEEEISDLPIEKEPVIAEPIPEFDRPVSYLLSVLEIPGQAIDVDASGDHAYLTSDLGVLYIIETNDKAKPIIVGKVADIPAANIVIYDRGFAYVSYTNWILDEEMQTYYSECGFKLIDARNKQGPYILSGYETGDGREKSVQGIFYSDDYIFLNTSVNGPIEEENTIEIVSVEDKKDPYMVSTLALDAIPTGVAVFGDILYVNTTKYDYEIREYVKESTLEIIDISDIENPEIISNVPVPANSWSLFAEDGFVYLSSSVYDEESESYLDSYIQIVDVSDPLEPELKGNLEIAGGAWEMDKTGDFLYISNNEGGVAAIDVSDKDSPEIADIFNTNGNSYDITLWGGYGYIADGFEGLVIIGLQDEDSKSMIAGEISNRAPYAEIDIYGDDTEDDSFMVKYPVYFSGEDSIDPDGDKITYEWDIVSLEGYEQELFLYEAPIEDESTIALLFEKPGDYKIELSVSDGANYDTQTYSFSVEETEYPIIPIKLHDFEVEIEFQIKNSSDITLKELECYMRTPQTYYPYQEIVSIEYSEEPDEVVFDNNWNKISHFEFEDLGPGQTRSTSLVAHMRMYEYEFKDLQVLDTGYEEDDPDLDIYTRDDLYIDSDNEVIVDTVGQVLGAEENPLVKAEKLYDFVIDNLYYDYQRAEEGDYEFWNASEILDAGRGVCADYAILYTALLRAAGIPARLVGGIPVYTILFEPNKELDVAHEWVELKLPHYGWISIDITLEEDFMSNNYFFNVVTDKGPGFLYEGTTMDWGSYYYDGYKYSWDGQTRPQPEQDLYFRVRDLEIGDLQKTIGDSFLINVGNVLDEYNLAINHMNEQYAMIEGFFDDREVISLEESYLVRLEELSERIKGLEYPNDLDKKRDKIVLISEQIIYYQQELINACKSSDYNLYTAYFDQLYVKIDELFDYYNQLIV